MGESKCSWSREKTVVSLQGCTTGIKDTQNGEEIKFLLRAESSKARTWFDTGKNWAFARFLPSEYDWPRRLSCKISTKNADVSICCCFDCCVEHGKRYQILRSVTWVKSGVFFNMRHSGWFLDCFDAFKTRLFSLSGRENPTISKSLIS